MKRVRIDPKTEAVPRYTTQITDQDISDLTKVSMGTVRVARCRGEFSTLKKLVQWINWQQLIKARKGKP